MINTQKNSRLLQILEQTNKYMEQLGAKVTLQKQEHEQRKKKMLGQSNGEKGIAANESDEEAKELEAEVVNDIVKEDESIDMVESEKIKKHLKDSSKIYYSVTHTV